MGLELESFIEIKNKYEWELITKDLFPCEDYENREDSKQPFRTRNNNFFGWIADLNNNSEIKPLDRPRGLPNNLSKVLKKEFKDNDVFNYTYTYFTLKELLYIDYTKLIEDRKINTPGKKLSTAKKGEGEFMSLKDFLGMDVMKSLEILRKEFKNCNNSNIRIIFRFS